MSFLEFLDCKAGLGHQMAAHDWTNSPLGTPTTWPHALQNNVRLILGSKFPMLFLWGPQLACLYNEAYLQFLGDKHPAAMGQPFPQVFPEIWPEVSPWVNKALAEEPSYFEDLPFVIQRNGANDKVWVSFSYSPAYDDAGRVAGMLCVINNTTNRVLAEKRQAFLLEMADSFRELTNPIDIMATASRLTGEYLSAGRVGYAEIDEDSKTASVDRDWTNGLIDSLAGESRSLDSFGPTIIAALRNGETLRINNIATDPRSALYAEGYASIGARAIVVVPLLEARRLTAAFHVHESSPREWTDEDVSLMEDVARRTWDAVRRARVEEELRDETRILEVLNNTGQSLASTLDLDTLLQSITDAATQLTGATFGAFFYNRQEANEEALQLYTLSGASHSAFEKTGDPRQTAVFTPTFCGEATILSHDITKDPRYGDMMPHLKVSKDLPVRSYLATSVVSRSGEVLGGLLFGHPKPGVFDKRTERVIVSIAAQAAVAIDNARLYELAQKSAEERERLLESERLARAEAERLNKMKDEFLAMLAHELRNPLAPITNAAYLLKLPDLEQRRALQASDIISRQVAHMTELVDDLLDVSRVTRGLIQLDKQSLDLASVISSALEQTRPLMQSRQQDLTLKLEVKHAHVHGDQTRLIQVVSNLLNNAAKYTPRGGEITLTLGADKSHAHISVKDNGCGIEASLLPHVFELFTQAARTPDRSQGGLGIGLALVKSIMMLHGGTVTVHSEGRNCGSSFMITLPLAQQAEMPPKMNHSPMTTPGTSRKIMVVDDNIDAAQSLATLLEAYGHSVMVKDDGTGALNMALNEPAQVFILDIGLPDMTGYELAMRLRERAATSKALLIALTGYGQSHDRVLSKNAGFDHHFVKPVDTQALAKLLAEAPLAS